ncbi:unnamed protein product [Paramecium pentaurelia]|uniref:Uncharacterized protein n=1 Tax=Paramecium pentaurelia TaxID=43138 RepID=A0A8S1UZ80_9CILI|nr:unnamed protein product [Paramecium pentaurelia]
MEQILVLIQQLFDQNESIRTQSEIELNRIFKDVGNIKQGFEQLLLPYSNQNLKLQYFIFLKNFIMKNYEYSPNYIQKEIQSIILEFINKFDSFFIAFYCDLLNFIIVKSLPSLDIIQSIINQPTYDSYHIKIITEMMNNPYIKVKVKHTEYQTITKRMIVYYNLIDIQKLNLLVDLYTSLIQSIYKFDETIKSTINHQFCEILTYHCLEYNLLKKFAKVINKLNKNGLPPQEIQTMLFDILMSTYMQNENQRITDKYLAYKILKVFKQLLSDRKIEDWKQESIIFFTMINLIMLDYDQYENQFNNIGDDSKQDYLLIKIRRFGAHFIHHMTGFISEDIMIKQLFRLKDLINDDYQHEEFNCIKLEAHYFVICENISSIPMNLFDEKFFQEIITIIQTSNNIYIPLKMQILNLLRKLLQKNVIQEKQINFFINTLQQQLNPNLIQYPMYICKIVNNLIYLHSLYPSKNLITHQTYTDLKDIFLVQQKLIHKENILMTLCEIVQLEQGDYSVISLIENEWKIGLQEQHQYKYRQRMILNVFEFIIEIWSLNLLNIIFIGIIRIVKDCLIQNTHFTKGLSVLCLLLKKYTAILPIKSDLILADFQQIQTFFLVSLTDEPDQFNQIIQLYYYILLHDIADYNLTFQFISKHTKQLYKNQQLTLLCLLFNNFKQGQYQEQIIQYYTNILQEVIYDEGRTYSELICGLSILDLNQYDVKQLLIEIQKKLPINNKIINIMIIKATNCIKLNIPNYINYLINFFNCMLYKQHLMYDIEQLTIENDDTQNLKQYISKMKSYLIPNNFSLELQVQRIFETKFFTKLTLCQEIAIKLKIDISKLQIQTEEQLAMENIHIC